MRTVDVRYVTTPPATQKERILRLKREQELGKAMAATFCGQKPILTTSELTGTNIQYPLTSSRRSLEIERATVRRKVISTGDNPDVWALGQEAVPIKPGPRLDFVTLPSATDTLDPMPGIHMAEIITELDLGLLELTLGNMAIITD